ncbi:MAG: hypothetical protein ACJ731_08675, partial [Vicinamibacterales bacterium]
MPHPVRPGFLRAIGPVVLLLALTHSAAAAGVQQAESPQTSQEATAEQTREQLERILEKYPPAVGRVLKLDPSLMTNQAYMAPYPLLSSYLAQHQEIIRDPGYFLERVNSPTYFDAKWRQRQEFYGVLAGVAAFVAFLVLTGMLVWV